jgi:hypothetical protein
MTSWRFLAGYVQFRAPLFTVTEALACCRVAEAGAVDDGLGVGVVEDEAEAEGVGVEAPCPQLSCCPAHPDRSAATTSPVVRGTNPFLTLNMVVIPFTWSY